MNHPDTLAGAAVHNGPTGTLSPLTKVDRLTDPFVAAGTRAYLIGSQAGGFPPIGDHQPGVMGGLWAHPWKLLDGFWCGVRVAATANEAERGGAAFRWLPAAVRFEGHPWGARQWFELPESGLRIRRTMLVPDGRPAVLIELDVEETHGRACDLEIVFLARSDLRPGWSSFTDPAPNGEDSAIIDRSGAAIVAKDPSDTWSVAWGALQAPAAAWIGSCADGPEPTTPRGASGLQRFQISLGTGDTGTLRLGVYGAEAGEEVVLDGLRDLLRNADTYTAEKQSRLAAMLARAHLASPDELLNRSWAWTHCAYDWLERDVPGIGHGLGAGLPDYPWWFSCDFAFALRGLLPLGEFALAARTLRLLAAASERSAAGSGRVIHELTCTGRVVNPGNTQETPQFACAVLETYLWSGDRPLLADLYPLCRQGVLSWTMGDCDSDGDLLPEGYGITEVAGLNAELIDSSVWAYEGLRALGRMATIMDDAATAARCADLAPRLLAAVEQRFWLPEQGLYADLVATPRAVRPRLERMLAKLRGEQGSYFGSNGATLAPHLERLLQRAEALPPDEETAWFFGNWVINAPLEAGLAHPDRAAAVLDLLESPEFLGPAGVYLNGIGHEWAMSIATGALAGAEVAYGRVDAALRLSRLLASQLDMRMPGAISEMSPDSGCFVQAWSGYGAIYPLVCGVFGLFPDAGDRHVVLAPQLPADWTDARLSDIRIGEAMFSVELERLSDGREVCRVLVDRPGWRVTLLPAQRTQDGTWVARTLLCIHAAAAVGSWGLAESLRRAGAPIELPVDQIIDLQM